MADNFNNSEIGSSVRAKINEAIDELNAAIADILTKQPLDADLTAIAGLSPSNDDFIQRVAGAWANRTIAQTKTSLSINNLDNTSDANKPVSTAQAAADAAVATAANAYTDASVTDKQIKFAVDTTLWNALPDNAAQTINTATQNKTLYISAPGAPISYTLNGGISTFPIGGTIAIFNNGAAPDISLVAGPGVTIYYNGTLTADIATKKGAMLFRVATNTWWRMS